MSEQASRGIPRRTLAKGASWAVPVVAVATATPAMAASQGPLTFTGNACKLPGNSQDLYKGYVFELRANNVAGPNPNDVITVITSVRVGGVNEPSYGIKVTPSSTCPCAGCVSGVQFCTPDGTLNQQVLVYTGSQATSENTSFSLTYQRYECNGTTCSPFGPATTISTPDLSTPPAQGNKCKIVGALPAPGGVLTTTTTVAPGTTTTTTTEAPVTTTTTTEAPVTTTTTTAG